MAYGLKQEIKLGQKLLLTPQLKMAIKLLQLTRQELVDAIREELDQNPVLEDSNSGDVDGSQAPEPKVEKSDDLDWQEYLGDKEEFHAGRLDFNESDDDEGFYEKAPAGGENLTGHLLAQLHDLQIDERSLKIGEFIIGNISDDGYLRMTDEPPFGEEEAKAASLSEIASLIGVDAAEAGSVLSLIQGFDPPGVGARTMRECLLLQAVRFPERDDVVDAIIAGHIEALAKKNYRGIAKDLDVPVERVTEAARFITEFLKPAPGSGFGTDESRMIIPDVYVHKIGGEYVVTLNDDGLPKLRISSYYRKMMRDSGGDVKGYMQERFKSALWLIKSVYQRQRTMKRVVESIVRFQSDFLDRGIEGLRPLVLKDVADDIGMHESTVSRVTVGKYAHMPRGIFELKYFFSSSVGADSNGEGGVTSELVKDNIKKMIETERPESPLSDQEIAERLKVMGMTVARRTVAKYREELGFLSSSGRKSHA